MYDVMLSKGDGHIRIENVSREDYATMHEVLSKYGFFIGNKPAKGYCSVCGNTLADWEKLKGYCDSHDEE